MWLIKTDTRQLTNVTDPNPRYAILSHCWSDPKEEVSFKEYRKGLKTKTSGYKKITKFCALAQSNGFEWGWIDTCCIDKRSSAELSESINSMYSWYQNAEVCYAFLGDIASSDWRQSKWWDRGWTLQELIAPMRVIFFDQNWLEISNKKSMADGIEKITGIPAVILKKEGSLTAYTVAQKMAWAARRCTTRPEDRAYSLLGLFKINMPMLYGEGCNAFRRLQLEIIRKYPDESIFGWQKKTNSDNSVLAESPADFQNCLDIQPSEEWLADQDPDPRRENPPRVTSWGIELRANARKLEPFEPLFIGGEYQRFLWAITLTVALSGRIQELPCTIILARCGPAPYSYRRHECHYSSSAEVLWRLKERFRVRDLEKGRLFYIQFDKDIEF